ncbi:anthrone oxygenase family protein [Streptomyces mayteni]
MQLTTSSAATGSLTLTAAVLTLVGAGAMAGLFFGFSVAVMPGLDTLDPEAAAEAMRRINERILNPVFLTAFTAVPFTAGAAGGLLLATGHRSAGWAFLLAAAVYLLGTFLPTAAVNVPLNDALAAGGDWASYHPRWTTWNTTRATFATLTLLLSTTGLCRCASAL